MKTVIMAGGFGTRISKVFTDVPKPMIQIDGKPILQREIECLRNQGYEDFILTVSYMADCIIDYFKDGKSLGVNIEYYVEEEPLGNAGALFKIRDKLKEDFLLLNADSLFDIDFNRFVRFHREKGGLATVFSHPNSHPYDSGLIIAENNSCIIDWISKEGIRPRWYKNRVNAGLHILNPVVLDMSGINSDEVGGVIDGKRKKVDLDRDILIPLCNTGKMFCYDSPEYVKDMGTPERFYSVCDDLGKGIVSNKNLINRQKAIFIDRDGTINKYKGFLTNIEDFELIPGVAEAIKELNKMGFLTIVVTNQPVVARGEVSFDELEEIHNKMETLLGEQGAYIDSIYFCPHHPDKGFLGEREDLKIDCLCRKPKPGMLISASEKFNIDLSKSWMIGDDERDIEAGKSAGCKTVLIGNDNFGQDITVTTFTEFINMLHKDANLSEGKI